MPFRLMKDRVAGAALVSIAVSMIAWAPSVSSAEPLIVTAQAQSKEPSPLERAHAAVEGLIAKLRGRDMPEGIVKTNGRLEATQVDVIAKYPGRLATVTVNEGDEVTAGQVVATISSPETEAQLRGAQAQVLKAKQALAEANALIVQRKSEMDIAGPDYDRGKKLVGRGNIPTQQLDQRRNDSIRRRLPTLRPRPSATKPSPRSRPQRRRSTGSSRFWSTWYSIRPGADGCSTGSRAPGRWSPRGSGS